MRLTRLLQIVLVVLFAGLLVAPSAGAEAPFRLQDRVTDQARVLSPGERARVEGALERLYEDQRIQLWVVYVRTFDGLNRETWAHNTRVASDFGDNDALLAVATDDRSAQFAVPSTARGGVYSHADEIYLDDILPALRKDDWAGAAVAAANGLNENAGLTAVRVSWTPILVFLGVVAALTLLVGLWMRYRRTRRQAAEVEAAHRVDPTDPHALGTVPLHALDELARTIVVDVDNAVRTSEAELALAVEEFGTVRTQPFTEALVNAKTALKQAFTVRQTLEDRVPETPLQRREMLTRVIVSAATADRELEAQSTAFQELRDLVINAPARLDSMTQQMVGLSTQIEPCSVILTDLRQRYAASALASVADNVDSARDRLALADRRIAEARSWLSRPSTDQNPLLDAVRAAEGALGQAQTLLDAVKTASSDIDRAVAGMADELADLQAGIRAAAAQLAEGDTPHADELRAAREAAVRAVNEAEANGDSDPLGSYTGLTQADAELDRVLALVDESRQVAAKQAKLLEQALFTARSRIRSVSDFIDTRRGSIGPDARTKLAEATRHLEAAEAKQNTDPAEAIAHANGAASLAAQAQKLANDDVSYARQAYGAHHGGRGGGDLGSMIGGIIIGNVLRGGGGFGGGYGRSWGGSWGGGRSPGRPSTYGGSSRSSTRSYGGGGGRF